MASLPIFTGPSVCEACGATFACGAALGSCWCSEVVLTDAARAELAGRAYEGCLCRACLENFARGKERDGEKEEQVSTGASH